MRRFLLFLLVLICSTSFLIADEVQGIFKEGQQAYLRGDYAKAKELFELVVKMRPNDKIAQNYLRMVSAQVKQRGTGNELERRLEQVIVPEIDFRDATLRTALEYLRQQAEKLTDGDLKTSFVLNPPELGERRVTLQLSSIPFLEALKYIGELTGLQFEVERHAIAVREAGQREG